MKQIITAVILLAMLACNTQDKPADNTQNTNTQTNSDTKTKTEVNTSNETSVVEKTVSETETSVVEETASETVNAGIVHNFLTDVSSLEKSGVANPITAFQQVAQTQADKVITLTKENIQEVLDLASSYKNCVITTDDHTIIKITDLNNCTQSGTWGACMPFVKGYIKKGDLQPQQDYMNNVIGTSETQTRKAYFFN